MAAVRQLAIVDILRRIWLQQYYCCDGQVHWRTKQQWGQPPAHQMIASPEDLEAKYCVKRATEWTGYKVHLTETCATEHPRLIMQVETSVATVHDVKVTETIQDNLIARGVAPKTQLVDMGYVEADLLVSSQQKGIDLVAPVPSSKSWQDRDEEAFDHTQFHIDWEHMTATCPGASTVPTLLSARPGAAPLIYSLPFVARIVSRVPCASSVHEPRTWDAP